MNPPLPSEQSPKPAIDRGTRNLILLAFCVGVIAVLFGVFTIFRSSPVITVAAPGESLPPQADSASVDREQGLGGAIYEKAANPIGDAIPDATSPAANPIDGAYTNPFE